jgi:FdhD protein
MSSRDGTRHGAVVRAVRGAGGIQHRWGIAVETPVEIGINGAPWTVMMATPADLEDLAVGIALTERMVARDSIEDIVVHEYLEGISVDLRVPADAVSPNMQRRRSLEGRVGCGLCGVEALAALPSRPNDSTAARPRVEMPAVRVAFDALAAAQPLNRQTHSVHAAAWCRLDGTIDVVREDVGRHNALDKVVGALARAHRLDDDGFIVMTSRCSFELVYKAALTRAAALATISAPTSLALDWSTALRLPLLSRGSDGELVEFPYESSHAP